MVCGRFVQPAEGGRNPRSAKGARMRRQAIRSVSAGTDQKEIEMDIQTATRSNVDTRLKGNPYPGRGLVVGREAGGEALVQVYWIMGRSPNSRNRVFIQEGDIVRTAPADPAQCKDPSLIIYNALRRSGSRFIVRMPLRLRYILRYSRFKADCIFFE